MNILIIEDDSSIQMLLKLSLEVEGFQPIVAGTVSDGLNELSIRSIDLILLDLMLPDQSGFELLKQLQHTYKDIPVIVLTAKNEMNDKILGFQLGADDYLTKPFETRELILRIRAVIRRMKADTIVSSDSLQVGVLEIDRAERTLKIAGKLVKTTSKEFELMWLLCKNPKKVFSREHLLDQVWGYEYYGQTRAVDMLVNRLREKLKPHEHVLATVHGTGYKLEG